MPSSGGSAYIGAQIGDLLRATGEDQARLALRRGDIWAGTIGDLANIGAGYFQQRAEAKAKDAEKQRALALQRRVSAPSIEKNPITAESLINMLPPEEQAAAREQYVKAQGFRSSMREARQGWLQSWAQGLLPHLRGDENDIQAVGPLIEELKQEGYAEDAERISTLFREKPGQVRVIAQQLAGVKPGEPYTLGPGQARFGPDNQPVAAIPSTPPTPERPPTSLEQVLAQAYARNDPKAVEETLRLMGRQAGATRAPKEPPAPKWIKAENEAGETIYIDINTGQKKELPPGVYPAPGTTEANRMASATAALESSKEIKEYLKLPSVKSEIGPIIGRYNSLMQAAGAGNPTALKLVGMLRSYSALQPNIHGFRAVQFAQDIEKLLTTKQTPEAILAVVSGIDTAAQAVRNRGRAPVLSSDPDEPGEDVPNE